ncbi:MAG: hypothetical protein KDK41_04740 [Leptospiraceae bacterium]|nr:hypothetical protein [Leptospiraceae bacterium]
MFFLGDKLITWQDKNAIFDQFGFQSSFDLANKIPGLVIQSISLRDPDTYFTNHNRIIFCQKKEVQTIENFTSLFIKYYNHPLDVDLKILSPEIKWLRGNPADFSQSSDEAPITTLLKRSGCKLKQIEKIWTMAQRFTRIDEDTTDSHYLWFIETESVYYIAESYTVTIH